MMQLYSNLLKTDSEKYAVSQSMLEPEDNSYCF